MMLTCQGSMMTDEQRKKAYQDYQQKAGRFQEAYMQLAGRRASSLRLLSQRLLRGPWGAWYGFAVREQFSG